MTLKSIDSPKLVNLIKAGNVGVIPTDTVYGLVCSALDPDAVARLYGLKNRTDKPGTVIAANMKQLEELGLKKRYLKAVEDFWPGPVSVVIPISFGIEYLTLGKGSLAVRLPSDEKLSKLLEETGPLLTTSANHPGELPITSAKDINTEFGKDLDFIVDGGVLSERVASAVIRIVDDTIEVIRPGHGFSLS